MRGPRKPKPRYNPLGIPIDPLDWLAQDWQDLHEAIEKIRAKIAARHKALREAPCDPPPRSAGGENAS